MKRFYWPDYKVLFLAILLFLVPLTADFSGTKNFLSWNTAEAEVYDYYIPYALSDKNYWTGVALKNGSTTDSASVTVTGIKQNGSAFYSGVKTIPPLGQTAFMMAPGEGWIKIVSDQPLTGLAFNAESGGDGLMFDMTLIPDLAKTLYVPHVAQDATWDTIVYVCNPNGTATTIYLTFVMSDGTVLTSKSYTLGVNASGTYPLSDVVGGGKYSSGSIQITASQGVAAFAIYNDLKSGGHCYAGISAVEPEDPPEKAPDTFTNSLGMKFVRIPAGTFMMGSPIDEPYRENEPMHQVTLSRSFYLQETEMTQGQWKAVMGTNPTYYNKICGENCPVVYVSWNECQDFINNLNQREGTTKYRMPTEAEWEYACRAGTTTPFNTGNCLSTSQANFDGRCQYADCPVGNWLYQVVSVKSYPPNAWGLYDMHGNAGEWCHDWAGPYPSYPVTDPVGPYTGNYRIIRGGNHDSFAGRCRSAESNFMPPGYRRDGVGFRVARDN